MSALRAGSIRMGIWKVRLLMGSGVGDWAPAASSRQARSSWAGVMEASSADQRPQPGRRCGAARRRDPSASEKRDAPSADEMSMDRKECIGCADKKLEQRNPENELSSSGMGGHESIRVPGPVHQKSAPPPPPESPPPP